MKILSIECSATPCSVAVWEDGKIIGSSFVNVKLTHSQTLMPMVKSVLDASLLKMSDIDGFAVSAGPGSFTGIRIGISAVKGMAVSKKLPCYSVSTLRAMAENYNDMDCIICAVMDARCNQVYNALFEVVDGCVKRICDDRALLCEELATEIEKNSVTGKKIIIIGDGAEVFYPFVMNLENVVMASEHRRFQNAVGVVKAAEKDILNNDFLIPEDLNPIYLRLPQAERELKLKKENKK